MWVVWTVSPGWLSLFFAPDAEQPPRRSAEPDAAEAYRIGLVQEIVAPGEQVERALGLVIETLVCAPIVLQ